METYPVFVLPNLLNLEPLGTLTLGHLPGDLGSERERERERRACGGGILCVRVRKALNNLMLSSH